MWRGKPILWIYSTLLSIITLITLHSLPCVSSFESIHHSYTLHPTLEADPTESKLQVIYGSRGPTEYIRSGEMMSIFWEPFQEDPGSSLPPTAALFLQGQNDKSSLRFFDIPIASIPLTETSHTFLVPPVPQTVWPFTLVLRNMVTAETYKTQVIIINQCVSLITGDTVVFCNLRGVCNDDGYTCRCSRGYAGRLCEDEITPDCPDRLSPPFQVHHLLKNRSIISVKTTSSRPPFGWLQHLNGAGGLGGGTDGRGGDPSDPNSDDTDDDDQLLNGMSNVNPDGTAGAITELQQQQHTPIKSPTGSIIQPICVNGYFSSFNSLSCTKCTCYPNWISSPPAPPYGQLLQCDTCALTCPTNQQPDITCSHCECVTGFAGPTCNIETRLGFLALNRFYPQKNDPSQPYFGPQQLLASFRKAFELATGYYIPEMLYFSNLGQIRFQISGDKPSTSTVTLFDTYPTLVQNLQQLHERICKFGSILCSSDGYNSLLDISVLYDDSSVANKCYSSTAVNPNPPASSEPSIPLNSSLLITDYKLTSPQLEWISAITGTHRIFQGSGVSHSATEFPPISAEPWRYEDCEVESVRTQQWTVCSQTEPWRRQLDLQCFNTTTSTPISPLFCHIHSASIALPYLERPCLCDEFTPSECQNTGDINPLVRLYALRSNTNTIVAGSMVELTWKTSHSLSALYAYNIAQLKVGIYLQSTSLQVPLLAGSTTFFNTKKEIQIPLVIAGETTPHHRFYFTLIVNGFSNISTFSPTVDLLDLCANHMCKTHHISLSTCNPATGACVCEPGSGIGLVSPSSDFYHRASRETIQSEFSLEHIATSLPSSAPSHHHQNAREQQQPILPRLSTRSTQPTASPYRFHTQSQSTHAESPSYSNNNNNKNNGGSNTNIGNNTGAPFAPQYLVIIDDEEYTGVECLDGCPQRCFGHTCGIDRNSEEFCFCGEPSITGPRCQHKAGCPLTCGPNGVNHEYRTDIGGYKCLDRCKCDPHFYFSTVTNQCVCEYAVCHRTQGYDANADPSTGYCDVCTCHPGFSGTRCDNHQLFLTLQLSTVATVVPVSIITALIEDMQLAMPPYLPEIKIELAGIRNGEESVVWFLDPIPPSPEDSRPTLAHPTSSYRELVSATQLILGVSYFSPVNQETISLLRDQTVAEHLNEFILPALFGDLYAYFAQSQYAGMSDHTLTSSQHTILPEHNPLRPTGRTTPATTTAQRSVSSAASQRSSELRPLHVDKTNSPSSELRPPPHVHTAEADYLDVEVVSNISRYFYDFQTAPVVPTDTFVQKLRYFSTILIDAVYDPLCVRLHGGNGNGSGSGASTPGQGAITSSCLAQSPFKSSQQLRSISTTNRSSPQTPNPFVSPSQQSFIHPRNQPVLVPSRGAPTETWFFIFISVGLIALFLVLLLLIFLIRSMHLFVQPLYMVRQAEMIQSDDPRPPSDSRETSVSVSSKNGSYSYEFSRSQSGSQSDWSHSKTRSPRSVSPSSLHPNSFRQSNMGIQLESE